MDEEGLEVSISTYKSQLAQVEVALQAAGEESNGDLVKLRDDLHQLISLTEESLLSLKKSKLLAMIDGTATNPSRNQSVPVASLGCTKREGPSTSQTDMDAEFAAFQAAIADDTPAVSEDPITSEPGETEGETGHQEEDGTSELFDELAGSKCRVPFCHSWGQLQYHNSVVLSIEPPAENEEPKVRVMFCNPTHKSMVPCPFYLEDRCRFPEEECRYSHGHVVSMTDLEEYKDPDYSEVGLESKCLARTEDDLWLRAIVVDLLEDHKYQVMFDGCNDAVTVNHEDLLPLDKSDPEDASDRRVLSDIDSDDEDDSLPVYLWRPQTADAMGQWEAHTRGIGSKLMAKMGYIAGQGLGRDSQGRAEPVPIQLLPQGKSLDKIMELKEIAGDRDLYDVMRKQKKMQKAVDSKASKSYKKKRANVFDFLNSKLGNKKANITDFLKHKPQNDRNVQHISERDLAKKTDKHINVQLFKNQEEIKKVGKEIIRLKSALERNEGSDRAMANRIRNKIKSMESYLQQLETSANSIQRQQKKRSDHKKLTIF